MPYLHQIVNVAIIHKTLDGDFPDEDLGVRCSDEVLAVRAELGTVYTVTVSDVVLETSLIIVQQLHKTL